MNTNSRALLRVVCNGLVKGALFCAVVGLLAWPWFMRTGA